MITLTPEALDLALGARASVCIDVPHAVSNCCFDFTECPAVRLGKPAQTGTHACLTLQGTTVYVPHGFPDDGEHVIGVRAFLGRKRLVLSGWRIL